ncbi:MAG: hypothetical protein Q9161_000257 [Pseudevernia consocians]
MSSLRRPVHKGSTRITGKPTAFDMLHPSGKTNGFVIQITEAPPSIIPETQDTTEQAPRQKPQPPPLAIPPKAYISDDQRPATPPSPLTPSRAASPTEVPLPRSSTNTPILVRSNSDATPVMRSMFPRYDPNIPFTQQHYRPELEKVPGLASAMAVAGTSSYRPPSYSQQANNRPSSAYLPLENERMKATDIKESPLRSADTAEHETRLSSPEELLDLWDIANGQTASEEVVNRYVLELSCDDLTVGREIITFNASTSDPIYTLEASHSNITVSRIHPRNRNPTIQITTSTLEKPTSAAPLVTCIFPKLAGLMALDHSSNVAVAHKLDRKASADLQAEAVVRAQEQEASMLLWDSDSNKYCFMHPTLLDSTATALPIEIIPDPSSPQKITIFAPETNTPLLTLSLQSLALTLHPPAITALPSLYILDALMSTLLALLLHLHRSCATPHPSPPPTSTSPHRPVFPPPPTLAYDSPRSSLRHKGSASRFSAFRSTKSMKSNRSLRSASASEQDIELQYLPRHQGPETVGRKHHQPPKQMFSTDDESLPKPTRAVLKLLYWAFEVLFWFMGVVAQLLAAGVVGAGKLVTKL